MGNMEEGNVDLLNMDQEDDNLIGISPANAELCITGVSPLSPSMMPKALKHAETENLENCYGKLAVVGVPAAVGADLDLHMAPVPCRSPMIPNSGSKVLSVLNFNEMNKRSVNREAADESKTRKSFGIRESVQLDGIAETSPVKNPGYFTSQLSRSYLDIENEQASLTPGKGRGEPTVLRKSRSRRSTTLRKSLAWDKAFFTDEGVLDNDELFAVASDTPKTLAMPELATIWDGPQNLVTSFEATSASAKSKHKSEVTPELRSALKPEVRSEVRHEARPEARPAVDPKPQQEILHTSLRPDVLHASSLRPVRQIHIAGSHAFSNAYSRAAAIPQGSTSIPLPSSLTRTAKQPGVAVRHPTDHSRGTGPDMKETRNITAGLHHQARIAALKKAHEAAPQKGPRIRLPNSISNKKVEDKQLEEIHKVKQFKKVEIKPSQEAPKMHVSREKQPRKVEDKRSEDILKSSATRENHLTLTRSMSTSSLHESPSALSRKVSSMSKRVKETLGKVMSGRARRVPLDSSLSHVHLVEKGSLLPKRTGVLPTVPEVKDSNHRTRPSAAVAPVKVNKETYTVRDILRGKGPPSCPKGAPKQGPTLTRSKSAFAVPGLTRATDPGLARVILPSASSAPSVLPATPPPVKAPEPIGKPTGLRKPSPKLGFFDAGRASSAPKKAFAISQPFNCMRNNQPLRPASEASIPIEAPGHGSRGLPPAVTFSAIPTAPHLRHCVASAPTSPRSIHVMHPSSPKGNSPASTKPTSPTIESVDPVSFSGLIHAKQFAESHQLLAKKKLVGDEHGTAGTAPETSAVNSQKLPISPSACTAVKMEPAELGHGEVARSFAESNPPIAPAVNVGSPGHSDSNLESGGGEPHDNSLISSPRETMSSGDKSPASASQHLQTSRSQPGEDYALEHRCVSETMPPSTQDTNEDLREKIVSSEAMESTVASEDPSSASLGQPPSLSSSSGRSHYELTKQAGFNCYSPRSSSFREIPAAAVRSCLDTSKPVLDTDIPPSACPSTPTRKECSNVFSAKISRQFESPRSKSFRDIPSRPKTATESPAPASRHVRSFSQRLPWQSPGGKVVGDASPGVGPSTPASGGKSHSLVSPSHAPDSAGTFEVLTPSSSKNARCVHTPGSSSKKVIRKIVEFESPSSQWSNWPVLGAAISADQLPVCGTEGFSSTPRPPSGEQATSESSELRAKFSSIPLCSPKARESHAELDRADNEHCTLDSEQSTDPRLSFSAGFVSSGCSKPTKFAEIESGSNDRISSVDFNGAEVCVSEQSTDPRLSFSAGFVSSGCSKPTKFAEIESGSNDRISSVDFNGAEVCVSAKSTDSRLSFSVGFVSSGCSKPTKFAEIESGFSDRNSSVDFNGAEACASAKSTDPRLSFSAGFVSSGCSKPTKFAEIESGFNDRNSSVDFNGAEVCVSAKKERRSSMFSLARKAVARLTSSPTMAEPSGQDLEETPKPSIKTNRRFSRSGSTIPVTEPKPPNLFSEARICELEAAGPEVLQKKNGPVTNSPPDKVVADSNPWSPVRKNGQPLGPFDCTKLTYSSRGLVNS